MANRFWVGGGGPWDNSDTTHWSLTTGGAGGASAPTSADTAIFDASSGGGTVTPNATLSLASFTFGAFTGTIDFSVNNNNVTIAGAVNGSGSGTRTFKMGNGNWTLTAASTVWSFGTTTGLTFDAGGSTIILSNSTASAKSFAGGGLTYNNISIPGNSNQGPTAFTGNNTFAGWSVPGPNTVSLGFGSTQTVTGTFSMTGTAGNLLNIVGSTLGTTSSISKASGSVTIDYAGLRDITFGGGATWAATNSYDLGHNSGITITAPSGGGGGSGSGQRVIGG